MTTWNLEGTRHHVLICNGSTCMRHGGEEVTREIRKEIKAHGADHLIHTTRTRCNGRCKDACVVIVYPDGEWYREVTPELGQEIIRRYLRNAEPIADHCTYLFDQKFQATGMGKVGIEKEMLKSLRSD